MNAVSSIIYQFTYIFYAFFVPKLILEYYGSDVNGLISSINQFLSLIALSEFGMTAVVQTALYKPLYHRDFASVNKILSSASSFFRKIGIVYVIYVFGLCIFYPMKVKGVFSSRYTIVLICILCLEAMAQYFFGLVYLQLLTADQRIYLVQILRSCMLLVSACSASVIVKYGGEIHFLKMTLSVLGLIPTVIIILYCKKKYTINLRTEYENEPIPQKWNGIAQHISSYVFSSTDVIILTLFTSLKIVSVYTVYCMVLNGLKQICSMIDNSVKPLLGSYWASGKKQLLKENFKYYEVFGHMYSLFIFGCAANLIIPFVMLYTSGVKDIDYKVPLFSFLLTVAFMLQNMKNIYHILVQSIGGFRETQNSYFLTAFINIVLSIILVSQFGLIGVVFGTVAAVIYQLLWLVLYLYNNILNYPISRFLKIIFFDLICFGLSYVVVEMTIDSPGSVLLWIENGVLTALVWWMIILLLALLFFKTEMKKILGVIFKKLRY